MAFSKLISCTILSPNHSGTRCFGLERITPHCMVGQLTAVSCGKLFEKESREASSNYGIGTNGDIAGYVDEKYRSWCTSSADNDNRAITIECASGTTAPYAMNDKVWKSLIALCTDICRRYGKDTLLWLGDKNTSLKYKPKDNELILTAHRWFAAKSCPGDWLYKRLGNLASEVTKRLKASEAVAPAQKEEEKPNTAAASLINNEETDREKAIWIFLSGKGLNAYAVAGLMGNLYAESALRPNNLQNSFEGKFGLSDKGYTTAVNNGSYKNFVHDGAGYGLAQWTWHTRKQNLLNFARAQGKSIDDLQMQLEFLWQELQGYSKSMAALKAGKSIKSVSDVILTDFEKSADQSSSVKNRRANFGREIYDRQTSGKAQPAEGAVKEPYALQFGAFSKQENARKRAKDLEKKNIFICVEVEKIGSFWKVRSKNRFATAAEASKARDQLSAKKINSVIVEV